MIFTILPVDKGKPTLYTAKIAPKIKVSINIRYRQHDEGSGHNPPIIHPADQSHIGSNW